MGGGGLLKIRRRLSNDRLLARQMTKEKGCGIRPSMLTHSFGFKYSITVSIVIGHFIVSAALYDSAMNHLGKLCSCA